MRCLWARRDAYAGLAAPPRRPASDRGLQWFGRAAGVQEPDGRRGTQAGDAFDMSSHLPARSDRRALVILHVIVGLQVGGAETALLRLVQNSDRGLLKHVVISLTLRGEQADAYRAAGAEVVLLNLNPLRPSILMILKYLRTVRAFDPDVIQGWMVHGNLFAWVARTFACQKAKLAWNLRHAPSGAGHEKRTTRWLTRLLGILSPSVDLLVSNSHSGLNDHHSLGYRPRREVVVANGFDADRFRPDDSIRRDVRAALNLGESIVFGVVGRVHPAKGYEVFVEAAKRFAVRGRDVRFVLIGRETNSPDGKLAALIKAANLGALTLCLGERHDVERLLAALDVLCVPSLYEGFPNAVGEAMAAALPCIASRVSDVPMILGDAGVIVEPGDAEDLYRAMVRVADMSPEVRSEMGRKARTRLLENFTMKQNIDVYTRLYVSLGGDTWKS